MTKDLVTHRCTIKPFQLIYVNAFAGGENGRCVQITTNMDYFQMTFKEAVDFFKTCIAEIEKLNEEYDKNPPWWEAWKEKGVSAK